MTAQMPQTLGSRGTFRDDLKAVLTELVNEGEQKVEGGAWDGVPVLTRKALDEAIAAVFEAPLPPFSETRTEVATPGTILVSADCPKCHIPSVIVLQVTSKLEVDDSGAELKLKAKAKGRTHVCGQQSLPLDDMVEGQESFELDDLEGDEAIHDITVAGEALLEAVEISADGKTATVRASSTPPPGVFEGSADLASGATSDEPVCDWPGCTRHAFHRGRHIPASPAGDGDSDLLPA